MCDIAGGGVPDALMTRDYTGESELPMLVGNDLGVGDETWVLDNGASKLMTPNSDFMFNYRQHSGNVRTAGGRLLPVEGSASIKVDIRFDEGYGTAASHKCLACFISMSQPPFTESAGRQRAHIRRQPARHTVKPEVRTNSVCSILWPPLSLERLL